MISWLSVLAVSTGRKLWQIKRNTNVRLFKLTHIPNPAYSWPYSIYHKLYTQAPMPNSPSAFVLVLWGCYATKIGLETDLWHTPWIYVCTCGDPKCIWVFNPPCWPYQQRLAVGAGLSARWRCQPVHWSGDQYCGWDMHKCDAQWLTGFPELLYGVCINICPHSPLMTPGCMHSHSWNVHQPAGLSA